MSYLNTVQNESSISGSSSSNTDPVYSDIRAENAKRKLQKALGMEVPKPPLKQSKPLKEWSKHELREEVNNLNLQVLEAHEKLKEMEDRNRELEE